MEREKARKMVETTIESTKHRDVPGWLSVDAAAFTGKVEDSGEGRWTVQEAVEQATPAPVLTAALFARFRSRQEATFGDKILSAMRKGFGGHGEAK